MRADLQALIDKANKGAKHTVPTEEQEQRKLAQWLDLHKVLWAHVPNGGHRNKIVAAKLKGQGTKRGVPDVLIFDTPPKLEARGVNVFPGVAIELKKEKGGTVSPEQKQWLEALQNRGWMVHVARGADDAIRYLEELGFGTRP